jgi:hydroxymethylpyrimidine pyrophosphatase-like HAD family hydrolase
MGNASPQVQQAADLVMDSNGEDGFAKAIERSSSVATVRTGGLRPRE